MLSVHPQGHRFYHQMPRLIFAIWMWNCCQDWWRLRAIDWSIFSVWKLILLIPWDRATNADVNDLPFGNVISSIGNSGGTYGTPQEWSIVHSIMKRKAPATMTTTWTLSMTWHPPMSRTDGRRDLRQSKSARCGHQCLLVRDINSNILIKHQNPEVEQLWWRKRIVLPHIIRWYTLSLLRRWLGPASCITEFAFCI